MRRKAEQKFTIKSRAIEPAEVAEFFVASDAYNMAHNKEMVTVWDFNYKLNNCCMPACD